MEVEVVVSSSSGKPIYHFRKLAHADKFQSIQYDKGDAHEEAHGHVDSNGASESDSHSFVSSIQGLISFVNCTQDDDLQEIEMDGCRCVFYTVDGALSYTAIVRQDKESGPLVSTKCLSRYLRLLHSQIVFFLTNRGLDVLQKQPSYDLRELLIGTDRVVHGLASRWWSDPSYRFKDFGVPFVRLDPEDRADVLQTIEFEPKQSSEANGMICGILLARGEVVAIAQPRRKQFSILVDDLLLLINFVYETPSFAKSETWTPVCLPAFNASGFLQAYIVFITSDIALVLLSTQQSPEQFHHFQLKRAFVENRLKEAGVINRILGSVEDRSSWRPHYDMPLVHHFAYKNELTGECATPSLETEFSIDDEDTCTVLPQLLDNYARLEHWMSQDTTGMAGQVLGKRLTSLQDRIAARVTVYRTASAVYVGLSSEDNRLFVWFDALAADDATLEQQCLVLVDRLKEDVELMSVSLFGTSASLWP